MSAYDPVKAKAYREANKERRAANFKAWLEKNREYNTARCAVWKSANAEHVHEYNAALWKKNKTERSEWYSQYQKDNKEYFAVRNAARVKALGPSRFRNKNSLAARWDYYGGKCWICGVDAQAWDHVKPVVKGGANIPANLRPVCKSCNSRKRDRWPFERAA
jgi:5-methylcytosine-specific restriction endonuclease McrA